MKEQEVKLLASLSMLGQTKVVFILFLMIFLVGGVSAAELNINPQYDHIKNFAIVYYSPTYDEEVWIGENLDLVISGYRPIAKQINPDLMFFKYMTCQSIQVGSIESIWDICTNQYSEYFCEDMFFHATADSTMSSQKEPSDQRFVPGWNPEDDQGQCGGIVNDNINDVVVSCGQSPSNPSATATYKNESRVPLWLWSSRAANFNNTFWAEYCTDQATASFATGYGDEFEGLMNDEIGKQPPSNIPVPLLELDSEDQNSDYIEKMRAYLTILCEKTNQKGKICGVNGPGSIYVDIVDLEVYEPLFKYPQELAWYQMNSTGGYDLPFNEDNYYKMKQTQRAEPYETYSNVQMEGSPGWWIAEFPTYSLDRDKYYFLSLYYQVSTPYTFFSYFPSNGGVYNIPPSTCWLPANEVDIGEPEGNWYLISGNNPIDGDYYEIFARDFTKAKVFTKPTVRWGAFRDDNTYSESIDLEGNYKLVNYDGSLGSTVTSIALRNQEGAILLKEEFAPGNPPTVNSVECDVGSGWESCENVEYGDFLNSVRINCVDGANGAVTGAQIILENLEDSKIIFSKTASESSGYWISTPGITIEDSGMFELSAICSDDYATTTEIIRWTIPFGTLSFTQNNPLVDGNVNQNQPFIYSTTITCNNGECGNIKAILDPIKTFNADTGLEDTYIRGGTERDSNYGSSNSLAFSVGDVFDRYSTYLPLIKYNNLIGEGVNSVPPKATINSAKLYAYQSTYTMDDNLTLSPYALLKNWTEENATFITYDGVNNWDGVGASAVTDRDQVADDAVFILGGESPITRTWYCFDLTRSVQMMADGVIENNGWIFIADGYVWSVPLFLSKESASNIHYLVVDYTEYGYKGIVPMNSGNPFYTTSQNPANGSDVSCLENMQAGDSCTINWNTIPTGDIGTEWTFFVDFESENYPGDVVFLKTDLLYLTIGEGGSISNDINFDGQVNIIDLAIVIFNSGQDASNPDYSHLDLDEDGDIDWDDVKIILNVF